MVEKKRINAEPFSYYIHDSVDCCRIQLLGHLSETQVPELSGCWSTARTTLEARQLVIDLRGIQSVDEAGHRWLLEMVREGATCVPESYFRKQMSSPSVVSESKAARGLFAKVLSCFRGTRDLEVGGLHEHGER